MKRKDQRHNATIRSFSDNFNISLARIGRNIIESNHQMADKIRANFILNFTIALQSIRTHFLSLFETHEIAGSRVAAYLSDIETRLTLLPSDTEKHHMCAVLKKPLGDGIFELEHLARQSKYIRKKTESLTDDRFLLRTTPIGNPIDNRNNVRERIHESVRLLGAFIHWFLFPDIFSHYLEQQTQGFHVRNCKIRWNSAVFLL